MNLSKLSNSIMVKEENEMFKICYSEKGLPTKMCESLKYNEKHFKVRLIQDWVLLIGQNTMVLWRYTVANKNIISSPKEYFLPNAELSYSPNQGLIIFDRDNKPTSAVVAGHDGLVRFWPEISLSHEYIDQKIPNIHNDECLLVDKVTDDLFVFVFKSMKLIIADMKDFTDAGISFKQFTQPVGFISRCLSSIFVGGHSQQFSFINLKSFKNAKEDLELLLLVDNNIDCLSLDILHNGKYTKSVVNQHELKRSICKIFPSKYPMESADHLTIVIRNFDLCSNILYMLVEAAQYGEASNGTYLVTFNRNLDIFDSAVLIETKFDGPVELSVIDDGLDTTDQPCLLAAIRDKHQIIIVEVLTGAAKANFSGTPIIGWTCPQLAHDPSSIITAVTQTGQIILVKQRINPFANESVRRLQADTNLSNTSFGDLNTSKNNNTVNQRGDVSFSSKIQRPMALSTPKTKLDQMGDQINHSLLVDHQNESVSNIDQVGSDNSPLGQFKKCVMLYWLDYKTRVGRSLSTIIEASQIDPNVSISMLTVQIAREIIDELPTKDPRWTKFRQPNNKFCYSNKSLILPQQLVAKREALHNLILMLKDNQFDLFGSMAHLAPISAQRALFGPVDALSDQMFSDCQVNWSLLHCIGLGGELLEFVRVFGKIMTNNQCSEISSIIARSCQDLLSVQKKLTPIDIICQQVSIVPSFITNCADYLNEKRTSLSDLNNFHPEDADQISSVRRVCQLLTRILSACLRASLAHRKTFDTSFIESHFSGRVFSSKSVSSACWITEQAPIGVSDSLMDIMMLLIDFWRGFDGIMISTDTLFDLVIVFLDIFDHRLQWMEAYSCNQTDLDRLIDRFRQLRFQLIEKLAEDGKHIDKLLDLADRFQDFHWITTLCDVIDESGSRPLRLDTYLRKHADAGLPEYVLDWYEDRLRQVTGASGGSQQQAKLLAKIQLVLERIQRLDKPADSSGSSVVIGKFLERTTEVQSTRWLHEIEMNEFKQAATTLLRLGISETQSLARKKHLSSLARLSALAALDNDEDEELNRIDDAACMELEMIRFQEQVPSALIESLLGYSPDRYRQPLIEVPQLVKLLLAASDQSDNIAPIVAALQLIQFADINQIGDQSLLEQLLLTIWTRTILADKWTDLASAGTIDEIRSTRMALVIQSIIGQSNVEALLPDFDAIFSPNNEALLGDTIHDLSFIFNVKHAFETILSTLTTTTADEDVDMDVL